MNINELTLGQIKELQKVITGEKIETETLKSELIGQKVIVRTYSAGVFYGVLKNKVKDECSITNARRIWYWDGAASLSQLAMEGTSNPNNCKFPASVNYVELTNVIETLKTTEKAQKSIEGVAIWKR